MSGRFYKTARAQHIDYAMKYPSELLFRAIAKKDAEVDQEIQSTESIKQGLKAQEAKAKGSLGRGMYSQQDEEDYKKEIGSFETEIGEITQSIHDDPYGKSRMRDISDVRSRVAASMTTGNLAMFNKSFNASKDFLEANKDIDPQIVAAAYKEGIDAWGKTIDDKTGEYRTPRFRSNLQDADVANEAYTWAKGTSNTLGTKNRISLTQANLKNDKEVMRTLWQNAELGILPIVQGIGEDAELIAPQDASKDQIKIAVDKEIERQAALAVATTMKYEKTGSTGSTKKEKKPVYAPDRAYISPEGTGLRMQSIGGRAIVEAKANSIGAITNEQALIHYKQNVDNAIKNRNYESGAEYFNLIMESAVLGYYNTEIQKLSKKPEYSSEYSTGIMKSVIPKESFINERQQYIIAIASENTVSVVGGWGGDRFEDKIYKQAVVSVNGFIKDKSRFHNIPLEDNMGRFASKSVNDMIEARTIRHKIENPKYIKSEKENLHDKYDVATDQIEISRKDNKYMFTMYITSPTEEIKNRLEATTYKIERVNDSPYNETGVPTPAYKVEVPLPDVKESATEFENFQILEGEPSPTLTINFQGGNYFCKPAMLDGEIIDLYIDTKAVGDNDYLKVERAEGMDNYLSTMHSMLRAEQKSKGFPENYSVTLFASDSFYTDVEITPQGFVIVEGTIDEITKQFVERRMTLEDSRIFLMGIMHSLPQNYEE